MDGYDEASLTGPFKLRTNTKEQLYHPVDLGYAVLSPESLRGGADAAASAKIMHGILSNTGTPAQKAVVVVNAALGIQCLRPEASMEECMAEAGKSLDSGAALRVWNQLVN
jgi:anthranilate phosphoribosyltransferase